MTATQHVLRFAATLAGLEHAAAALRVLLDAQAIDGEPRFNVELVFDEIAANIVRHGHPATDVRLSLRFDAGEIVLEFDDDGVPFDPLERPDPVMPATIEEAPVGGLGVFLVKKVVTRVAYARTPQQHNLLTLAIPSR